MKGIYRLNFNCGRQGTLNGIFIAEKEHVKILIENKIEIYFGEVLGKHSEIFGPIADDELVFISDNSEAIKIIEDLGLENGYNPFNYTALNFEHEGIESGEWTIKDLVQKLFELKEKDTKKY